MQWVRLQRAGSGLQFCTAAPRAVPHRRSRSEQCRMRALQPQEHVPYRPSRSEQCRMRARQPQGHVPYRPQNTRALGASRGVKARTGKKCESNDRCARGASAEPGEGGPLLQRGLPSRAQCEVTKLLTCISCDKTIPWSWAAPSTPCVQKWWVRKSSWYAHSCRGVGAGGHPMILAVSLFEVLCSTQAATPTWPTWACSRFPGSGLLPEGARAPSAQLRQGLLDAGTD